MPACVYSLTCNETDVDLPAVLIVNTSDQVSDFLDSKFDVVALTKMNATIDNMTDEVQITTSEERYEEDEEHEFSDELQIIVSYQCDGSPEHCDLSDLTVLDLTK